MADELNIPTHRWYQKRNHVALAKEDVSRQYIYDSGIQKIDAWINSQPWGDVYIVNRLSPNLVFDFDATYYRTGGTATDLVSAATHTRAGNATMVDSDGFRKWAPHNLLTYSEEFDNAAWSKANVSVTTNATTAPDGTLTADKIINTGDTGGKLLYQSGAFPGQTTVAVYTKAAEFTRLRINELGGNRFSANFDISAETATLTSGVDGIAARITSAGNGWYLCELDHNATAAANSIVGYPASAETTAGNPNYDADDVSGIYLWGAHLYRSDLGGMVNNPDRGDSYVPTTSAAAYLPRVGHHIWNGSAWVDEGYFHESEARTNLLLNSDTLATQSVTVTAVPHTLHFTGTGTVTLTGASTAGPLVGTGTGEQNRVSLTFTPTAGTLIVTVTGTVTNAGLEVGSTLSSYIPTAGATVTRAADAMTIPAANLPWNPLAVSIQMEGTMTYADTGNATELFFLKWDESVNDRIQLYLDTSTGGTGQAAFQQKKDANNDIVRSLFDTYSPGINVPFNIASRHGSTFINGAVDGTALTANLTPTALPYLENTDMQIGTTFNGTIKLFRVWADDLTDAGIEEASA